MNSFISLQSNKTGYDWENYFFNDNSEILARYDEWSENDFYNELISMETFTERFLYCSTVQSDLPDVMKRVIYGSEPLTLIYLSIPKRERKIREGYALVSFFFKKAIFFFIFFKKFL